MCVRVIDKNFKDGIINHYGGIMILKSDLVCKLQKIDKESFFGMEELPDYDFSEYSKSHFPLEKKAILGLDIYKYGDYEENKQNLIPFVFDLLFDEAIGLMKRTEQTLFNDIDIRKMFIQTGDGGYIIFDTPLHALIFNFIFYAQLHLFNTSHFYPKLSKYIGGIVIRSTITYDNLYCYEKNFYGKAIINNARILSKDRLNRFLMDKNTFDYFNMHINGLESLSIIGKNKMMKFFKINDNFETFFFENENIINSPIRNIHIQKLDDILSKDTKLTIYNIEVQVCLLITDEDKNERDERETEFIYTIGNTNINNIV
jgi:hypothetical protein